MVIMIWIGAAMSIAGLGGLIWCILRALALKGAELSDSDAQGELNKLIFGHMASIACAFLGLGILVAGLFLS